MSDLRKYARQTNIRIILGGIFLVFTLGLGLIYIFYGRGGAITGLVCLLAAFVPISLVIASLQLMDILVRRAGRDPDED